MVSHYSISAVRRCVTEYIWVLMLSSGYIRTYSTMSNTQHDRKEYTKIKLFIAIITVYNWVDEGIANDGFLLQFNIACMSSNDSNVDPRPWRFLSSQCHENSEKWKRKYCSKTVPIWIGMASCHIICMCNTKKIYQF